METATISIAVDADTAQGFSRATPAERRKLELLLGVRLRELTVGQVRPLSQIMDEIGAEAAAQGLTPATVESLLRDA